MTHSLADQIRCKRRRRKVTQTRLANLCGLTQSRIAELETGSNTNPTLGTVARVADALGCELRVRLVENATGTEARGGDCETSPAP